MATTFVAVRALHGHVRDVGAGIGNLRSRVCASRPRSIGDQQPYPGLEYTLNVGRPLDVDDLIAVDPAFLQRLAVAGMHQKPLAAPELSEDGVARNRAATLSILYRNAFDAAQLQRARPWPKPASGSSPARLDARVSACATTNDNRLPMPISARMSSRPLAPYSRAKRFPALPGDRFRRHLERRQGLLEHALAEHRRLALLQRFEEVPDARARLAGADEVEPRRIGARRRRRHDLDLIAVLELGSQRHQLVVDPRRSAMVADVGVHRVGEIDRGGTARQRHDLALWE